MLRPRTAAHRAAVAACRSARGPGRGQTSGRHYPAILPRVESFERAKHRAIHRPRILIVLDSYNRWHDFRVNISLTMLDFDSNRASFSA